MKFPKFPHLKSYRGWACSAVSSLIAILAAVFSLQQHCQAQQQWASQSDASDASMDPLKSVNWYSGPQTVAVGVIADINIPSGYRFTDVHGARMILASLNSPIPDDLVGIIAPASGHWMATLEYSPAGYVANPNVTQINTQAVLKQVLNQITKTEEEGQSSIKSLTWQSQPTYDSGRHLLEWSLLVATPSIKVLNESAVIFGSHGYLGVTVARSPSLAGVPPLKQIVDDISFNPGESYADHRNGDKIAEIGLAELISGENNPQTTGLFGVGFGAVAAWTYGGLAVCLMTGGVVIMRRRNRIRPNRRHRRRANAPVPIPAIPAVRAVPAAHAVKNTESGSAAPPRRLPETPKVEASVAASEVKNATPANNAPSNPASVALKNDQSNAQAPKPVSAQAAPKPVFGPAAQPKPAPRYSSLAKPINLNRHIKPFDYHNFFTNFMCRVSRLHYVPPSVNYGKSDSNGHAAGSNGANINQTFKSEMEELIAIQKSVIQEQKSLMEQQSRLIEEKRRLIDEQTAILKTQSALANDERL